jgi:hypothetical protein
MLLEDMEVKDGRCVSKTKDNDYYGMGKYLQMMRNAGFREDADILENKFRSGVITVAPSIVTLSPQGRAFLEAEMHKTPIDPNSYQTEMDNSYKYRDPWRTAYLRK